MRRSRQTLAGRIVAAFVLMTLMVSGLFCAGLVAMVHTLESHLVSMNLDGELQRVLKDQLSRGQPPQLPADTRFFSFSPGDKPLPPELETLGDGFDEILLNEQSLFAYQKTINDVRYILLQDQHNFEQREQALFSVVAAGFLLSLLLAWGLGVLLSRRVMAPIIELAERVQQLDSTSENAPLAADYPNDEVGQLARRFDVALEAVHLALQREQLFTSDVSHELRTPLMVISSSCELLLASEQLTERQRGPLQRIHRASEEMRELVQVFLTLAREQTGEDGTGAQVSLEALAREQYQQWAPQMAAKGLHLELVCEAGDDGEYNATLLRAVLSNLLRNALHYADRGIVTLALERGALRVEDCGPGIPPDQRDSIFHAFVRGDAKRGEGLGLGLSLVTRICRQQGWRVSLSPRDPAGSCFRVELTAGS